MTIPYEVELTRTVKKTYRKVVKIYANNLSDAMSQRPKVSNWGGPDTIEHIVYEVRDDPF